MLYRLDRSGPRPELVRLTPDALRQGLGHRRVVLLPGAGLDLTRPGTPAGEAAMAGSIKYIEQALAASIAKSDEPIDIYLYLYEETFYEMRRDGSHGKTSHYRHAAEKPNFMPTKIGRHGVRDILVPLLLQPGESWKTIDPAILKKRCSDLTLVGHSFGQVMIQHLDDSLAYELRRDGWSDEMIDDCLHEVVGVSAAGVGSKNQKGHFTQFHFVASNDMAALGSIERDMPPEMDYRELLRSCGYPRVASVMERQGASRATKEVMAEVKSEIEARRTQGEMPKPIWRTLPSGYSIHALLPEDEIRWIERNHEGREVCRVLNHAESARVQTPISHDFRNFLHGEHKMGDVLINVLNNAVTREVGIGDAHQLAKTTEATRQQHAHRYERHKLALASERGILR